MSKWKTSGRACLRESWVEHVAAADARRRITRTGGVGTCAADLDVLRRRWRDNRDPPRRRQAAHSALQMNGAPTHCGLLAVMLLSNVACTHGDQTRLIPFRPCPSSAGCVTFVVYKPNSAELMVGAPVLLIGGPNVTQVGVTDDAGVFLSPKDLLTKQGASALLFCWDARSLGCTAVRLDTGVVSGFDLLNIILRLGTSTTYGCRKSRRARHSSSSLGPRMLQIAGGPSKSDIGWR
jgi:hypothetical protein